MINYKIIFFQCILFNNTVCQIWNRNINEYKRKSAASDAIFCIFVKNCFFRWIKIFITWLFIQKQLAVSVIASWQNSSITCMKKWMIKTGENRYDSEFFQSWNFFEFVEKLSPFFEAQFSIQILTVTENFEILTDSEKAVISFRNIRYFELFQIQSLWKSGLLKFWWFTK